MPPGGAAELEGHDANGVGHGVPDIIDVAAGRALALAHQPDRRRERQPARELAMRAVGKCGSDDPDQVLANLRDSEFDAPQGRVRIDPENNHTYLWPRIARLDRNGRFQTVWNPGVRVKPDPYCVVQRLDDWSVDDLHLLHP